MDRTKFETSIDDLLAAYRLNFKVNLKAKRARRNLIAGGLTVSALCAAAAWIWQFTSLPVAAAFGLAYWVLFVTAVFGAAYLRLPRQTKVIYAQQKSLHGTTTVEWNDAGISFISPKGRSHLDWTDFTEIHNGNDVIVLRQSDTLMNFIPVRALTKIQVGEISRH